MIMIGYLLWLFAIVLTLAIYLRISSDFKEATNLTAVSRFDGIEEYYQKLKARNLALGSNIQVTAEENVCKTILSSYYFEMRQEKYLDVGVEKIRTELQNDYHNIFNSIYEGLKTSVEAYLRKNTYKKRKILTKGRVYADEMVITCLARQNHSRNNIKEYFVTRQYNVNSLQNKSPIFGRFILSRDSNNDLILLALAEEPATENSWFRNTKFAECVYAEAIGTPSYYLIPRPSLDPVCQLTDADKLRLCTSLFGAPYFKKNEYKFNPTLGNVHLNCVKKQILLTTLKSDTPIGWLTRNYLTGSKYSTYEEWMIGCTATTREGNPIVYHVSRSNHSNSVFVFIDTKDNNQQVLPYNLYARVAVIDKLRKKL